MCNHGTRRIEANCFDLLETPPTPQRPQMPQPSQARDLPFTEDSEREYDITSPIEDDAALAGPSCPTAKSSEPKQPSLHFLRDSLINPDG